MKAFIEFCFTLHLVVILIIYGESFTVKDRSKSGLCESKTIQKFTKLQLTDGSMAPQQNEEQEKSVVDGFNIGTPIRAEELKFSSHDEELQEQQRRASFLKLQKVITSLAKWEGWEKASLIWEKDREVSHVGVVPINSIVCQAYSPHTNEYEPILIVLPSSKKIDLKKVASYLLEEQEHDQRLPMESTNPRIVCSLVPTEDVEATCGFPPMSVPPLGHSPKQLRTLVDSSLSAPDTVLLGGGGHPRIACWIDSSTLLKIHGTELVDVTKTTHEEAKDIGAAETITSYEKNQEKPYFQIAPPNSEVVELVLDSGMPNPIEPIRFQIAGRISGIRRMAGRLAFVDFAPIDYIGTGTKSDANDMPWRSAVDGQDMAVQLIAGKSFCAHRKNGDGPEALKRLKVGQLVLIDGRTNVGNRESLGNWQKKRSLDIVLLDYRHLEAPHSDAIGNNNYVKKSIGASKREEASKSEPFLELDDVLPTINPTIHVVDTVESIDKFVTDLKALAVTFETNDAASSPPLVGIDCEWKPNFLLSPTLEEKQPVLILQASLQRLGKIYLFDLQGLLRPCLHPSSKMNYIESETSAALTLLFDSGTYIKVGYQLATDLQRLAGSYPHIQAFRNFHGIVETSTVARKMLKLARQKNPKPLTGSLSALAKFLLTKPMNKEQQISDWSIRPLSQAQRQYAALDAAVTPKILETCLKRANASWFSNKLQFGRGDEDKVFDKVVHSFRFLFLESHDSKSLEKLKPKTIVSNYPVVTQLWVTGTDEPERPTVPTENKGTYVDLHGVFRVPAQKLKLSGVPVYSSNCEIVGCRVGKSKDSCLKALVKGHAMVPSESTLEYPARSGYVEFVDSVALFVTMPKTAGESSPRRYPNMWMSDGKYLTWFLRPNDWLDGTTSVGKKLIQSERYYEPPILFVRMGRGFFLCCGRVTVVEETDPEDKDWGLVGFRLCLLDWGRLQDSADFVRMTHLLESGNEEFGFDSDSSHSDENSSLSQQLANLILKGDVVGAMTMALKDRSKRGRSIEAGLVALKNQLTTEDGADCRTVTEAKKVLEEQLSYLLPVKTEVSR